jgi:hypothetical protein
MMLADVDGAFTRAIGLSLDSPDYGLSGHYTTQNGLRGCPSLWPMDMHVVPHVGQNGYSYWSTMLYRSNVVAFCLARLESDLL